MHIIKSSNQLQFEDLASALGIGQFAARLQPALWEHYDSKPLPIKQLPWLRVQAVFSPVVTRWGFCAAHPHDGCMYLACSQGSIICSRSGAV